MAVTRQQYDIQRATVAQDQVTVQSDQAQIDAAKLNVAYCEITSPIDGVTGLRLVDIGNLVQASAATPLVVVTQIKPIYVTFTVPERDLDRIRQGMAQYPLSVLAFNGDDDKELSSGTLKLVKTRSTSAPGRSLPPASVGALLCFEFFGFDLSVIAIIGLIMLTGIVKKNAIMMIDFALERVRHEHKSAEEAIYEAAVLRFRPIIMTTMSAIFGILPIAIGIGAGSELRQPLGVAVVGGLVMSQALTLFTIQVTYVYMERLSEWLSGAGRTRRPSPIARDHALVAAGHYPRPAAGHD
jgi:hypothetical protein